MSTVRWKSLYYEDIVQLKSSVWFFQEKPHKYVFHYCKFLHLGIAETQEGFIGEEAVEEGLETSRENVLWREDRMSISPRWTQRGRRLKIRQQKAQKYKLNHFGHTVHSSVSLEWVIIQVGHWPSCYNIPLTRRLAQQNQSRFLIKIWFYTQEVCGTSRCIAAFQGNILKRIHVF